MRKKVYVVAEAGVNHNGSIETAKKMIDAAADSGADAVKFQTFIAEKGLSKFAPKADYQKNATLVKESQLELCKKLELDLNAHNQLLAYAQKRKIAFLSTPFDLESIDLLNSLGLETFKIPSGEIVNLPYLRKIGSLRKRIILSTGMANLEEIKIAVSILVESGTSKDAIIILHCNTEYPTPMEDANLLAILTIRDALGVDVGYSDHTLGIEVPIAAVSLGAVVIEKHFTLDRKMPGPDHQASLEPNELKDMVRAIRNIEKALGNGVKNISASESKNRIVVRKSIVAVKDIKQGESFSEENISVKRPGSGMSPMEWDRVIDKKAKRDFEVDELIEL